MYAAEESFREKREKKQHAQMRTERTGFSITPSRSYSKKSDASHGNPGLVSFNPRAPPVFVPLPKCVCVCESVVVQIVVLSLLTFGFVRLLFLRVPSPVACRDCCALLLAFRFVPLPFLRVPSPVAVQIVLSLVAFGFVPLPFLRIPSPVAVQIVVLSLLAYGFVPLPFLRVLSTVAVQIVVLSLLALGFVPLPFFAY
jgi:hypothetical protein